MTQTMSTFILNIRPEDDAARDTETLKRHGVAALSSPVMSVSPLSVSFGNPDNISGIIFTSRHAVALFVKDILSGRNKPHDIGSWLPKPIYVVGSATARVARAAGFQHITKGDGGGALWSACPERLPCSACAVHVQYMLSTHVQRMCSACGVWLVRPANKAPSARIANVTPGQPPAGDSRFKGQR